MSDKEIIKDFKNFRDEVYDAYTTNVECGGTRSDGTEKNLKLLDNVLDLIDRTKLKESHYRQKTQNQREIINAFYTKVDRLNVEIRSLKRQLESARLELCELCQRLGEDICRKGEDCAYKESEEAKNY